MKNKLLIKRMIKAYIVLWAIILVLLIVVSGYKPVYHILAVIAGVFAGFTSWVLFKLYQH